MATADVGLLARLARTGHGALAPVAGVLALERVLMAKECLQAVLAVALVDWRALGAARARAGAPGGRRFLSSLVGGEEGKRGDDGGCEPVRPAWGDDADPGVPGPGGGSGKGAANLRTPPALATPSLAAVTAGVLDCIESVLGRRPAPADPLMAAGLDSLAAVELRDALGARFAVSLPATAALDAPTVAALADEVLARSMVEYGGVWWLPGNQAVCLGPTPASPRPARRQAGPCSAAAPAGPAPGRRARPPLIHPDLVHLHHRCRRPPARPGPGRRPCAGRRIRGMGARRPRRCGPPAPLPLGR